MSRLIKNTFKIIGASPGTSVFIGDQKTNEIKISLLQYNQSGFLEKEIKNLNELENIDEKSYINWLNIDGLHEIKIIDYIGKKYNIHSLIIEDILNTQQTPKIEIFDDYIYITLKMFDFNETKESINVEQISLILNDKNVISFQEKTGDIFEPIRKRIKETSSRIRKLDSDYLLYSIIDIIVDYYFLILEKIGDKIEILEEELVIEPKKNTLKEIYKLKRELLFLRKSVWPIRENVNKLEKSDSQLIKKSTSPYLRDLYDHSIQIIDTIETSRDLLGGMLDLYLSSINNKMNEIMKVLTIISTIFIPLTFISGVYGMNFKHMPELEWKLGYFIILGIMFLISIFMLFFFRKKKWL
ncbi:MAG: magnesium/cobalt transporter CorA [Candidatus Nanoarchaeia archaeon]|nr:magnesium/cobalt transporter CorA [Candidatus Nanoarchaeia archaeon]